MKRGSLFSGAGGFEFAAQICGMALPCVLYVMEGVKEILKEETK